MPSNMRDSEFFPSLNEVTSLAKKAVRGAGMSWGVAEEAASSVQWLSAHKLPGPALLAGLLERQQDLDIKSVSPQVDQHPWESSGEHVCPLLTACVFSDNAALWQQPAQNGIEIVELAYPLLLLPTIAKVSAALGIWMQVSWDKVVINTDGKSACIQGSIDALTTVQTKRLYCLNAKDMLTLEHSVPRQPVDRLSWEVLEAYAQRTYAPATEESRRLGAGDDLPEI